MKYLKNVSLFAIVFLLLSVSTQAQEETKLEEISPIRATLMIRNDGALMVDVREKNEIAVLAYDVENIINVPLSELAERMSEIPKDKTVIMACRSGNRSRKASNILLENGYTKVVNMDGGIIGWQAKKLDVVAAGEPAVKKACCAKPNSKDCNPDGTCKKGAAKATCKKGVAEKSCCKKGAKATKKCCAKKVEKGTE